MKLLSVRQISAMSVKYHFKNDIYMAYIVRFISFNFSSKKLNTKHNPKNSFAII